MSFLVNNIISFILCGFIYFYSVCPLHSRCLSGLHPKGKEPDYLHTMPDKKGYRDIIWYRDMFLAVGTGGRVDFINISGEISSSGNICSSDLNCAISEDQMLVIGGAEGIIFHSSDGKDFIEASSGTTNDINEVVFSKGLYIAGADNGTILISGNGESWSSVHLPVRGNILSLAANGSFFTGVTDEGEIIRSVDGINWEITDYNKEYAGFNKACKFKKVILAAGRIMLVGVRDDGLPAVLFSTLGNVWTERSLVYYDNHGMIRFLMNGPNDITYDSARDQFILACDSGELFSLPSCTKCNVSVKTSSNDLFAVTCNDNILISAGEEFYVNIINL